MTPRILLQYPGGEITLFQYKRNVPDHALETKLADVASTLFPSWEWAQGDIPAIEPHNQNVLLLAVTGPSGKECFL